MPFDTNIAVNELMTAAELNRIGLIKITDSTLGADAASFDLTSIPAGYGHLELRGYLRGATAASSVDLWIRFNNDSGANYDYVYTQTRHSATVSTGEGVAANQIVAGFIAAASAVGNSFTDVRVDVDNYANTSNHKTMLARSGSKLANSTSNIYKHEAAGWWRSTSAISRITVLAASGNLLAGSRLSLYGVRD